MKFSRRQILGAGGGLAAACLLRPSLSFARDDVLISMHGDQTGAHVWFDPYGILIEPGQTIRWINQDKGNSHTSTAYAASINDRPQRIPRGATAWDSDYLLPDQSFAVTFSQKGVYDYYCVPHEHAGMVGRIIVGEPNSEGWVDFQAADGDLPEIALQSFPDIAEIVAKRVVRRV